MQQESATTPGLASDDRALDRLDPAVPAAIERAVPAAVDEAVPSALNDSVPEAMPAVAEGAVRAAVPTALDDQPIADLGPAVRDLAAPVEQLQPMVQELPAGR